MPTVHAVPSPATIKELYANAYCCAYPGCRRPLYKVHSETGERTLNSRVSHICARSEGGPRWDSNQLEDENRSVENLLLLCLEHASEVDQTHRVADFPAELLRKWKKQQLADFDSIGQGWALTSQMAEEAAQASFQIASQQIVNSTLDLGGTGGSAPGAGGGGGGAVGPGARGGTGGPGGTIRYEGDPMAHVPARSERDPLPAAGEVPPGSSTMAAPAPTRIEGSSGIAPGAGGGGQGAVGDNAYGGDGGGGGEHVVAHVSPKELEALRAAGFDRLEISIGEGGKGSRFPGEHGQDGDDSVVNFVAADGRILRTIRAAGGKGGRAGGVPPRQCARSGRVRCSARTRRNDNVTLRKRQAKLARSSGWKSRLGKVVADRPVASVASWPATARTKRTQRSDRVGY
jgi:hypothetical protein